jgi:hypothetical protein
LSNQKLTPWYSADVQPVRPGLYQRDIEGDLYWGWWDGRQWNFSGPDKAEAVEFRRALSGWQNAPWRGLAADPKGGA